MDGADAFGASRPLFAHIHPPPVGTFLRREAAVFTLQSAVVRDLASWRRGSSLTQRSGVKKRHRPLCRPGWTKALCASYVTPSAALCETAPTGRITGRTPALPPYLPPLDVRRALRATNRQPASRLAVSPLRR